jgi:nucleotide-binding universal stress UspA family protein
MLSRIVVSTDGSPDASEAIRVAAQVASGAPGSVVHVVTAYDPLSRADLRRLDLTLPSEFDRQLQPDLLARPIVDEVASLLQAWRIDHEVHEIQGGASETILAVAREVDADLIVVGSQGEGTIDRILHGSTSTRVLHDWPCSVLVVKAKRADDAHQRPGTLIE